MPPIALATTDGARFRVDIVPERADRLALYAYPRTSRPGEDPLTPHWDLALTRAVDLPTFDVAGHTLLKRLTLVVRDGVVEHLFYPVFPPDGHAAQVLEWLRAHPVAGDLKR